MEEDEVKAIAKILHASWSRVKINAEGFDFRQLSFQLLGRSPDAKDVMLGARQRRASVKRWTRSPHSLPVAGFVENMDASLHQVHIGGDVMTIAALPDPSRTIVKLGAGEVHLMNLESAVKEEQILDLTDELRSLAVSRDGR